jgi:hypothetical protein
MQHQTPKAFEEWCKRPPTGRSVSGGVPRRDIADEIANTPSGEMLGIQDLPIAHHDLLTEAKCEFGHIKIDGDGSTDLKVCDVRILKLYVVNVGKLTFKNCEIGELITVAARQTYRISNCMIGHFHVVPNCMVQRLEWDGGYLGQFSLRRPLNDAFVGDVWFHKVKLSTDDTIHDVQWLRDTREALNARSNTVAAGIFHASELALTRRREDWTFKIASWIYQAGSNFGNSIARPFVVFLGAVALLIAIALGYETDLSRERHQLAGWQTGLYGGECRAQVLRALLYAWQSINPFNFFGGQQLVVVRDNFGAALGGFVGAIGIAAVALFALSLRRHFKLE